MISVQHRLDNVISLLQPVRFDLQPAPLTAQCRFDVSRYDDSLFSHYGIDMPSQLQQAVAKRRCEYLAGRVLFQQLLQHYRLPARQLLSHPAGAPVWPAGFTGSISHADGQAICCLVPDSQYQAIGIDIETLLSADSCAELAPHILQPEERLLLSQLHAVSEAEALTIAFSAKESLYKALYPQVQRFFGFEEARLIQLLADEQQFTLKLNSTLSPQFAAGTEFRGHYRMSGQQVISLIALPAC